MTEVHLIFGGVSEKEGEGAVATHGVTKERGVGSVELGEMGAQQRWQLFGDIVIHAPVLPFLLSGI